MDKPLKPLHIFKAGRHTSLAGQEFAFSDSDLQAIAAAYDPKVSEAPLVVGHPKVDSPAYGWVASLKATPEGLFAEPDQVDPAFAEAVNAGRYKKISVKLWAPDHPKNPAPGSYYIRHVGFLGATPPAVKGLRSAEFADDGDDLVEIEFGEWTDGMIGRALRGLREWFIGKYGLEEADKALPGWTADALIEASVTPDSAEATPGPAFSEPASQTAPPQEHPTMTPEEITAAQQKLAADQAAFAQREKVLKDREAKAAAAEARAGAVEFAESLVDNGQLPASQKERAVELLHTVAMLETELSFAEGDATIKSSPEDALKALLQAMPKQIEFAELSGADRADPTKHNDIETTARAIAGVTE